MSEEGFKFKAELVCAAGPNLELWRTDVKNIREQDINAQYMIPEMFNRLAGNIQKEMRLESIPLAVRRQGYFELVSGHHRVRACRTSGITEILLLADTRDLDRSQVVAKQIAHNRLVGQTNEEILARLVKEIEDVDAMIEAYVDMKELGIEPPPNISIDNLALSVDWRTVTFSFLPPQMDKLQEAAEDIPDDSSFIGVVPAELYEKFRSTLIQLKLTDNIRSVGTLVSRMIELTQEYIAQQKVTEDVAEV